MKLKSDIIKFSSTTTPQKFNLDFTLQETTKSTQPDSMGETEKVNLPKIEINSVSSQSSFKPNEDAITNKKANEAIVRVIEYSCKKMDGIRNVKPNDESKKDLELSSSTFKCTVDFYDYNFLLETKQYKIFVNYMGLRNVNILDLNIKVPLKKPIFDEDDTSDKEDILNNTQKLPSGFINNLNKQTQDFNKIDTTDKYTPICLLDISEN